MSSAPPKFLRYLVLAALAAAGLLDWNGLVSRPSTTDEGHASREPSGRGNPPPPATGTPSEPDLWQEVARARLAIQPLTPEEAALEQNLGVSHFAWHPGQDLAARFMPEGVRFSTGADENATVTFRYDRSDERSILAVDGARAEYRHADGVTEWFVNGREGIEHGFTLAKAPAPTREIHLKIRLEGLAATHGSDVDELLLQDGQGIPRLRYTGLKAWDADGEPLPATMTPDDAGILIAVNDAGARYPLTIDPVLTSLAQQLRPEIEGDAGFGNLFGESIALDGDTALIGSPNNYTASGMASGAAYVFVKSGGTWGVQARLHPAGISHNEHFGTAVDLQGDRAVITALNDNASGATHSGSVHVFERSEGTWQFRSLIPSGRSGDDHFGRSIALDHDTIAVGAPEASLGGGSVSIFAFNGTEWNLQQTLDAAMPAQRSFGDSVALEGNRLVAGAPNAGNGSAFLYLRDGGVWTGQPIPPPASLHDNSRFGCSVAISGETVVVGAFQYQDAPSPSFGAAFAYLNAGTYWTAPQVLQPDAGTQFGHFGVSVAVDGDLLAVGACSYQGWGYGLGATYVFERPATTWEKTIRLELPGNAIMSSFGAKVAVSGQRVLVAAPTHQYLGLPFAGAAMVFSGPDWSQEAELAAGNSHEWDEFGTAVAIDGNTAMIGIPKAGSPAGSWAGEVMVLSRQGGQWAVAQRLTSDHPYGGEQFGSAIALDGDSAMIGAPRLLDVAIEEGCAYIFAKQDGVWQQQAQLRDPAPSYTGHFGSIIAMDGPVAVVGKPSGHLAECVVQVFTRSGVDWGQRDELRFPSGESGENFGSAVAIEGNTLLVGATAKTGSTQPSTVQVFTRSEGGWLREASLMAAQDGPDVGLGFGTSVAISGDTALIGSPRDLPLNPLSRGVGRCYFFKRNGNQWSVEATIYSGDGPHADCFGTAVALDGDVAVVGMTEDFVPRYPSARKAAYIFTREPEGWVRQSSHLPMAGDDSMAYYRQGARVAVSGHTVVIGVGEAFLFNPFNGLTAAYGQVDILDLSGKDEVFLKLVDADDSGTISLDEWRGFYGPAKAAEKEFRAADVDGSGSVGLEEIVAAKTSKKAARLGTSIERVGLFMELDRDKDLVVTREEIEVMYLPGTETSSIDAFWSRSGGAEGFDLEAWVRAKTLPSASTYETASQQRKIRRSLAAVHDADHDGSLQFDEFREMFPGMKIAKIEAHWRSIMELPKRAPLEGDLWHEDFVNHVKLPLFR